MTTATITALLGGAISSLTIPPHGPPRADDPPRGAILSGAFNPLHHGHEALASAAAALTGLPVAFELAVRNADKGALDEAEVARRAAQFAGRHTLLLSGAPLFVQKAALYPGRVFVLGYDTAVRLVAPRYYGGAGALREAMAVLRAAGCRFLVGGRLEGDRFCTLDDMALPPDLADLFAPIPEALFRADVSSTALRARAAAT